MLRRQILVTAMVSCISASYVLAQGGSPIRFQHSTSGARDATYSYAINNAGQVAGCVSTGESLPLKGMVYHSGNYRTFEFAPPPGPGPQAITCLTGMNNKGQAIGYFSAPGTSASVLRHSDGRITKVKDIAVRNLAWQTPYAINDRSEIVGTFANDTGIHGFLRYANGTYKTIDYPASQLPGNAFSDLHLTGINNAGTIVGHYEAFDTSGNTIVAKGFVYENGRFRTLRCTGKASGSPAKPGAINNRGQILIVCGDAAYVMNPRGRAVEVNTTGLVSPSFTGLNDYADVVGFDYFPMGVESDTPESFVIPGVAPLH
jgi:uncharacterized membrane protein